jgi:hypothetical protein
MINRNTDRLTELISKQEELIQLYQEGIQERDYIIQTYKNLLNLSEIELQLQKQTQDI